MDKRFLAAAAAAFVTSFILSFIAHGVILAPDYSALPAVYRGPQLRPGLFSLLILAMVIMASAMAALYRYGAEDKPWLGQGVRFGLMTAGVSVIPCYLIGYVVTNIPGALAVKQIVFETIIVVAMGIVIAWFYRR